MDFDEFARLHLARLLRFSVVLCADRGLAEDVVQEVLTRAYSRWDRIAPLDQPDAFVRRMIVNEFLSWRRKWTRITPVAEVPESDAGPDVEGRYADRDALVGELRQLPRRQRAAVVLRFYGELSDAEIAEQMGCSAATVRSHISRALATLRLEMRPVPTLTQEP